ncbi:uncharacterized protein [Pocillopora verrucosa]|uniref:uncharacterized protein n=1 Tax=Pocillopora verrucosa TaxID=203993 RepID=UPI0033403703
MEQCNQFQAGSNLRSKNKSTKLDERAHFGGGCKDEVPLKFFSLKRGEEIGDAVYLLKWIKNHVQDKAINIRFFYDIACVLDTHLRNRHQETLLENVTLAIPAFHCYGHKVSCQVNYSGRRLEGFGMSDCEVMERLWSYLRPTAKITKEMTPAHRVDTLTDFLMHYAKKSISDLGERLRDHLKKAVETEKETEEQLNLLLEKLNKTGIKVDVSSVSEWSMIEKSTANKAASTGRPSSSPDDYPDKLRQFFCVRTNLQKCSPASETWKVLTDQLDRLDQQLKNLEGGQPRWSPDSSMYIAYLRDLQDKRREDLLLSMHVKCSERWFLLQLMKKYADGQAIAKRLCAKISKATGAIKQLVKEYTRQNVDTVGCKYPSTIAVEDALSIDSPLWRVLNDDTQPQSAVPYCLKRQLVDLFHTRKRCLDEIASTKEEMARMFSHFEGKLKVLDTWSKELMAQKDTERVRALLSIASTK